MLPRLLVCVAADLWCAGRVSRSKPWSVIIAWDTRWLRYWKALVSSQLHDALSYYYDHQAEIDADIKADELPAILERFQLEMDADGVLRPSG